MEKADIEDTDKVELQHIRRGGEGRPSLAKKFALRAKRRQQLAAKTVHSLLDLHNVYPRNSRLTWETGAIPPRRRRPEAPSRRKRDEVKRAKRARSKKRPRPRRRKRIEGGEEEAHDEKEHGARADCAIKRLMTSDEGSGVLAQVDFRSSKKKNGNVLTERMTSHGAVLRAMPVV